MPIKVRVGQSDAIKILSSAGGGSVQTQNSVNVVGGIASVTQLNVSGISTFIGDVGASNLNITGITTVNTLNITGTLNVGIDGGSFWWQDQILDKD